jgi:hypothetical protein
MACQCHTPMEMPRPFSPKSPSPRILLPSVRTMASTSFAGQFHTMAAWRTRACTSSSHPLQGCTALHKLYQERERPPTHGRRTVTHHFSLVCGVKEHATWSPIQPVVILHRAPTSATEARVTEHPQLSRGVKAWSSHLDETPPGKPSRQSECTRSAPSLESCPAECGRRAFHCGPGNMQSPHVMALHTSLSRSPRRRAHATSVPCAPPQAGPLTCSSCRTFHRLTCSRVTPPSVTCLGSM